MDVKVMSKLIKEFGTDLNCSFGAYDLFLLMASDFDIIKRKGSQASRLISIGKLNTLLCLHLQPIEVVVFNLPSEDKSWDI